MHLCACGSSLSTYDVSKVICDDPDDRYLVARLTGVGHSPVPLLDHIPLKEVISAIERLGLAMLKPWSALKPVVGEAEAKAARTEGMQAALAWEAPFRAALDGLVNEAGRQRTNKGLIGTYGWVYEHWVSTLPDDAFGTQIKALLRHHAITNGVVAEGEGLLGTQRASGIIDVSHAARVLGLSYKRTRQTLDRAGLLPRGARRGVPVPISLDRICNMKAAYERTVNLNGVRSLLKLGKTQTRRIVLVGLIQARSVNPGEVSSGRFLLNDVQDFIAGVRARAPQRRSIPTRASTLSSACRSVGVRIEVALRQIVEGKIKPIGVLAKSVGIDGILVHPVDLRRAAGEASVLTVEGVARELGIHHDVARFLVRRRYLPVRMDGARRCIDRASLQQFRARHISGVEVAKALGTSPRHIATTLSAVGVTPVIGPPECRQLFFDRKLTQDGLARLAK
jgi:hypothetical protein